MRYIIIEFDKPFEKFEIDKKHLVDVQNGKLDLIIDSEENKYFKKEFNKDAQWYDMKPYDKRYES